jgi:hypothetical protein
MRLLYLVSAVILGSETARRIFHVESIIQDPNVQELIKEWDVLEARSFRVTSALHDRIIRTTDRARLEAWHRAAVTAKSIDDVFGER